MVLQINLRFIKRGARVMKKQQAPSSAQYARNHFHGLTAYTYQNILGKKKTVENSASKFQAEIQATHGVCKVSAECVHEQLYLCEGTVVFKFFAYLLSQAPKLALKPPQPQIKVRLTPGPLTFWQPTNS